MTTRLQYLQGRIGAFPIELPAAALMAFATALCVVALPDWRFESMVAASGLPALVGAAQPPLGQTARIVVALALAGLSFLGVWFGLRALDAKSGGETDFPAFRAADLHPDAPRRRPILAGAEFGAPADGPPPIEEQLVRRKPVLTESLPSFLAPQPPAIGDFMAEPQVEPEPIEPVETFFEPAEAEVLPTRIVEEEAWPVEAATATTPEPFAPEPYAREIEPNAATDETPDSVFEEEPEAEEDEDQSVGDLMARLEGGLARRGWRPMPGPGGHAQEELRRALGDLNRISGRTT